MIVYGQTRFIACIADRKIAQFCHNSIAMWRFITMLNRSPNFLHLFSRIKTSGFCYYDKNKKICQISTRPNAHLSTTAVIACAFFLLIELYLLNKLLARTFSSTLLHLYLHLLTHENYPTDCILH